eukprot:UN30384
MFTFNKVLGINSTQLEAYEVIGKPAVEDCLNGINTTVIMYGQTGSGKTYTTFGPEPFSEASHDQLGVLPLSFAVLFQQVEQKRDTQRCIVQVQIMEIYLGHIRDLLEPLDPESKKKKY